jgi:hypothetical protein
LIWKTPGSSVARWAAGDGSFTDVSFGDSGAWVMHDQDLSRVDLQGQVAAHAAIQSRESQILLGDLQSWVVCRKTSGRPMPLSGGDTGGARCRSSAGWSFNGTWFRHPPLACGDNLVQFDESPEHREWIGLAVRDRASGAERTKRVATGQRLTCLDDTTLIETETGRRFALPNLATMPPLNCGQTPVRHWAVAGKKIWCIDALGALRPATP